MFHASGLGKISPFIKTHSDLEYLFIYMATVEFGLVNVIQVSAFTSLITWQSKTKSTECVVFMCGFKKKFQGGGRSQGYFVF